MTKTKLKPCPFCGGEALEFYATDQVYQVYSDGIPTEVKQDKGEIAREALKGGEE